jgi:hypothetical protein
MSFNHPRSISPLVRKPDCARSYDGRLPGQERTQHLSANPSFRPLRPVSPPPPSPLPPNAWFRQAIRDEIHTEANNGERTRV